MQGRLIVAISGDIEMVYKVENGIKIELASHNDQPTGQKFLTIIDPTWIPEIGMYVDGGGEAVTIQRPENNDRLEGLHIYYREGWSTLHENFSNRPLLEWAYWCQHGRAEGKPKPR
jgi:hypothetical protein